MSRDWKDDLDKVRQRMLLEASSDPHGLRMVIAYQRGKSGEPDEFDMELARKVINDLQTR